MGGHPSVLPDEDGDVAWEEEPGRAHLDGVSRGERGLHAVAVDPDPQGPGTERLLQGAERVLGPESHPGMVAKGSSGFRSGPAPGLEAGPDEPG